MILKGQVCTLRPFNQDDVEKLSRVVGNREVMEGIRAVFPISDVYLRRWIEDLYQTYPPKDVVFAIETENKLIGSVGIYDINWTSRHGTFSIVIWDSNYHGRGIGTEATVLILDYAFDYLNLHRVKLEVYEYNRRAIHIYQKLGFIEEGRWRKQRYLKGKYYDVVLMGMLREEWKGEAY